MSIADLWSLLQHVWKNPPVLSKTAQVNLRSDAVSKAQQILIIRFVFFGTVSGLESGHDKIS